MKPNSVARWFRVFLAFFVSLLTANPFSLSIIRAQSLQESVSAIQQSAGFAPPDFSYFSVFDQYQRYQEEAVASWPEANVTVGQIGGWRFYAEEASQMDTLEQPLTSPLPDDSDKHTGHGGKP
ncbi:MAG: hypothetical protein AB7U63_07205 [Porticoccaceae bacterium]